MAGVIVSRAAKAEQLGIRERYEVEARDKGQCYFAFRTRWR
jgi:hypothetical protein